MARYYTGAITTQESLAAAIDNVLTDVTGLNWNQNELDNPNDEAGWNDGAGLFISMDWDNANDIRFYQATAWDGAGTAPGSHTGDSGSDHMVNAIGDSMVAYHAFTNDGVGDDFAYFVIEHAANFYRHFGFGSNILKHGGWSGGQFMFGNFWSQTAGNIDTPNAGAHSVLFDGGYSVFASAATIKIVGTEWPNPPSSAIWGVATSNASTGTDTATNGRYRCQGGVRRSQYTQEMFMKKPASGDAFVPGSPVPIWAKDDTYAISHWMKMGNLPEIYLGSMENFADEAIKDFGGQDWMLFPFVNSSWAVDPDIEQSGNAGIWYRRT
jgi:hypothetical protein